MMETLQLMPSFMWAQVLGLTCMVISMFAWQMKEASNISIGLAVSHALWVVHYMMLNSTMGAIICLFSTIRFIGGAYLNERKLKILMAFCLIAMTLLFVINYKGPIDILPFIGSSIFTLSYFRKDNRALFVRGGLFSTLCWAVYAVQSYSIFAFINALVQAASQIKSMQKYENWEIGNCYKSYTVNLIKSVLVVPNWKTYP